LQVIRDVGLPTPAGGLLISPVSDCLDQASKSIRADKFDSAALVG